MKAQQIKTVLKAIRKMERACLSMDHDPTTARDIRDNGLTETRRYFYWLKQQAPVAGMFYDFDQLIAQ